jgi:hypothetical protein
MHRNAFYIRLALLTVLLPLVGCGGSSTPASPSGHGVVLNGVVIGSEVASSASAGVSAQANSGSRITVTVEGNPSLSATVSASGTFVLEGLPAGSFTLVFTLNGVVIGTINITGVGEQVEIHIVVKVTSTTVVLVNLDMGDDSQQQGDTKTCLISGGRSGEKIELEGDVASGTPTAFKMDVNGNRAGKPVDVSATAASFVCNGDKKDSATTCQATVKAGAKVHVSGTLTSCTLDVAQVVATEVKVQKAAD